MKSDVLPAPFGPMIEELALGDLEADIGDDRRAADVEPEIASRQDGAAIAARPTKGVTGGWRLPGEKASPAPAAAVRSPAASRTWNIGCSMAWSACRIRCTPFGATNCQPSSAEIIRSTSSPPRAPRATIICAATKPSGVKMSGTWLRRRIFATSQLLTLFLGAFAT